MNNLRGLLVVVMVIATTAAFAQTSQPSKERAGEGVKQEMIKKVKKNMPKADLLDGFDMGSITKQISGLGLSPKALKAVTGKNTDLLMNASRLVKGGATYKEALKSLKGLNKGNLKDLKGMLPKDGFKSLKPVQKGLWTALKGFLLKKLG